MSVGAGSDGDDGDGWGADIDLDLDFGDSPGAPGDSAGGVADAEGAGSRGGATPAGSRGSSDRGGRSPVDNGFDDSDEFFDPDDGGEGGGVEVFTASGNVGGVGLLESGGSTPTADGAGASDPDDDSSSTASPVASVGAEAEPSAGGGESPAATIAHPRLVLPLPDLQTPRAGAVRPLEGVNLLRNGRQTFIPETQVRVLYVPGMAANVVSCCCCSPLTSRHARSDRCSRRNC